MADYGSGRYRDRGEREGSERSDPSYDSRYDDHGYDRAPYGPHRTDYQEQDQYGRYRGGYQRPAPPPPKPKNNNLKYFLVGCGVLAVLASCVAVVGGSGTPAAVAPSTTFTPVAVSTQTLPAATQAAVQAPPVESAETAVDLEVTVPNVVGMDLQSAQELLFPALRTTSYDATGQGRLQLVDSNWVVVRQDPVAGSVILTFTDVKLYVQKIGE